MPIFEFKCLKCDEFIEFLVMNDNDRMEMKCQKCKSDTFERVLSKTNYAMNSGTDTGGGTTSQTRTCSSGSSIE